MPEGKKTIAISGGSRGIGRAIAEDFAGRGWRVAIAARNAEPLEELQLLWRTAYPDSDLLVFAADLAKVSDCRAWAGFLGQHCSRLDALVNNIGSFAPGGLLDGDEDQLSQFFQANVFSAHYLTRAFMPMLEKAELGHIVTIGSMGTTDFPEGLNAYTLSKHALETWHRLLRKELATTSIRTTLLRPGATYTSSWDGVDVDPTRLLSAERVASWAAHAVLLPEGEDLEEICLRPKSQNE